ncbi:ABC transporter permease [Corynebacterium oculi]|uniref:Oligopeptide transport system permease protein OppC n=1 Tax=Corynebacterium oculi TaxID=1544416 RepID=A0A0Q1DUB8_9CORY|nr:ABC transporter permease [Corynebacterium oculi]KQB83709.1 Oligopeptide transport system permease protein OppC [Corynebacterium oculi]
MSNYPYQEHFVADAETPREESDATGATHNPPASQWAVAWRQVRRRPLFWISAALIAGAVLMALFPQLFSSADPRACDLARSLNGPEAGHIFGFDRQGCDIYARTVYGARASVLVGTLTTALVVLIGTTVGAVAGYFGGIADTILSRLTDVFFAVPLVLAAIVVMQMFRDHRTILTVVIVLGLFGWTSIARITRGTVMSVKNEEYVTAARAMGQPGWKTLLTHIVPNSAAPIIVYATVALGTFIVAEATLSFLGIGLPTTVVSWGGDISAAQASLRTKPMVLFYPASALALTVLSFIMMGDVVRDALDPKARKR